MSPRIIFINRYFYPDTSATSQLLSDLAFDLAARGRDVIVLTSAGLYRDANPALPRQEIVDGVTILRLGKSRARRVSLPGRALDYLGLYWTFARAVWAQAEPGDIVVVKTDPPLLSVAIAPVVRWRRLTFVNWLQDLYPEVAERLHVKAVSGPVGTALRALRNRSLRIADANVAIGERMADELRKLSVPDDRIACIPNWSDDIAIKPQPVDTDSLRTEWDIQGKFVVGYSGNLGRVHEYKSVILAADQLRAENDILFLFIGGGHLMPALKQEVATCGLDAAFQFRPYQPKERLSQSLALADVHWLSLIPEMEGLVVPSKFYGIAAAGRPTLAVTAADGEVARCVRAWNAGLVTPPGDGRALADAILELRDNPGLRTEMGANARRMLDREFTGQQSRDKWFRLISSLHQTTDFS